MMRTSRATRRAPPAARVLGGRVLGVLMILYGFLAPPSYGMTSREAKQAAFQALNQGTLLYEQGDYRGAIDLLRQATSVNLNSFQAHYQLGLALRGARLYQDAIEPLSIALELNPKHLQAHVALGDCHLKLGDVREAEAEYHRALDLQPDYAAAYDGLGRLMEAMGRPEDAVYYYQRGIEVNAGYPDAYLDLGDLYQRQGRLQEAAALLLKAIQIRPDFAAAYNRLGVVYSRQQLWQEAVAALREAERLEPKNPYHPLTLSRAYLDLGSLRWAREALERALSLDPTFAEAYLERAALERREGNYEAALEALRTGLNRVESAALRETMREELARLEAERDRVALLKERVASGAGLGAAVTLARHYADSGDYEAASRTLDGRLDPQQDDPALVAEWGYYLIKARRHAEARAVFQPLARRRLDDYASYVNLGIAEAGSGRYDLAIQAYQAALRLKPQGTEAMLYLGNLYLRLGELDRARETYQAYLKVAGEDSGAGRVRKILSLVERLRSPEPAAPGAAGSSGSGGAP